MSMTGPLGMEGQGYRRASLVFPHCFGIHVQVFPTYLGPCVR